MMRSPATTFLPTNGLSIDPTMVSNGLEKRTTFRRSLAGRQATEELLTQYISSLAEWRESEMKAAVEDVDFPLREAVCAIANSGGGEVFLGLGNDRTIIGTGVTEQRLTQVLQQANAPPGDWYIVDLTRVVHHVLTIPLPAPSSKRFVYVLEVTRPGLPLFVHEENNELSLYLRHGESSIRANSFSALEWGRNLTREEILRTCYLELKVLSRLVSEMFAGMAIGLGLTLPYLTKRLEDGTFYQYLTDEDIIFILGRARGGGGYEGGIVRWVFETRRNLEVMRRQGMDRGEEYRETDDILRTARESMPKSADSFKRYLEDYGIAAD